MINKNTFPFAIEKQQEQLFVNAIRRLSGWIIPIIKRQFRKQKKEEQKIIKIDAENFGELENELLENFNTKLLESGYIASEIEKVAFLLDAWAVAKTRQSIKRIQKIKRTTAKNIIPIIFEPDDPLVLDFLDTYIKQNIALVDALGKEFIPEVSQLASQTFLEGGNIHDLRKSLKVFTEGSETRAAFWARDQVGTAYSQLTMRRQLSAGFTTYIWNTVGDNKVRDNHIELNNKIFTWKNGAAPTGLLTAPGAKHPGEDYNCRCVASLNVKELI